MVGKTHNNVAFAQTGTLCRTVLLDADDEDSSRNSQMMPAHENAMQRCVLARNSNIASPDLPILDQSPRYELRGVDCRREADALRRQNDRCVYADHFAVGGNEW